jgi:hypothetical protein
MVFALKPPVPPGLDSADRLELLCIPPLLADVPKGYVGLDPPVPEDVIGYAGPESSGLEGDAAIDGGRLGEAPVFDPPVPPGAEDTMLPLILAEYGWLEDDAPNPPVPPVPPDNTDEVEGKGEGAQGTVRHLPSEQEGSTPGQPASTQAQGRTV